MQGVGRNFGGKNCQGNKHQTEFGRKFFTPKIGIAWDKLEVGFSWVTVHREMSRKSLHLAG